MLVMEVKISVKLKILPLAYKHLRFAYKYD